MFWEWKYVKTKLGSAQNIADQKRRNIAKGVAIIYENCILWTKRVFPSPISAIPWPDLVTLGLSWHCQDLWSSAPQFVHLKKDILYFTTITICRYGARKNSGYIYSRIPLSLTFKYTAVQVTLFFLRKNNFSKILTICETNLHLLL